MQGQIWGETIRTDDQMFEMAVPRLIALAERAWHHADWEDEYYKRKRDTPMKKDWTNFINTVGHKELKRLNISYYLPPPGVA